MVQNGREKSNGQDLLAPRMQCMGFLESSSDSVCIDEILEDYHDYYIHKRKKERENGQKKNKNQKAQIFDGYSLSVLSSMKRFQNIIFNLQLIKNH